VAEGVSAGAADVFFYVALRNVPPDSLGHFAFTLFHVPKIAVIDAIAETTAAVGLITNSCQFLAVAYYVEGMKNGTLNVSLSGELLSLVNREVQSGQYVSGSEVVREALREWFRRRFEADEAALEKAHHGAWTRDTTSEELDAILKAKRQARTKLGKTSTTKKPQT
jgi:putative addiction module CopG family antidote